MLSLGLATIIGGGTVLIVTNPRFTTLGNASLGPVKVTTLLALAVIAVLWVLLSAGSYGRALFAVGGNEEAARLSGIRTARVKDHRLFPQRSRRGVRGGPDRVPGGLGRG